MPANTSGQSGHRKIIIPEGVLDGEETNVIYIPSALQNLTTPLYVKKSNKMFMAQSLPEFDDRWSSNDASRGHLSAEGKSCPALDEAQFFGTPEDSGGNSAEEFVGNETRNMTRGNISNISSKCGIDEDTPSLLYVTAKSTLSSPGRQADGTFLRVEADDGISPYELQNITGIRSPLPTFFQSSPKSRDLDYHYFVPQASSSFNVEEEEQNEIYVPHNTTCGSGEYVAEYPSCAEPSFSEMQEDSLAEEIDTSGNYPMDVHFESYMYKEPFAPGKFNVISEMTRDDEGVACGGGCEPPENLHDTFEDSASFFENPFSSRRALVMGEDLSLDTSNYKTPPSSPLSPALATYGSGNSTFGPPRKHNPLLNKLPRCPRKANDSDSDPFQKKFGESYNRVIGDSFDPSPRSYDMSCGSSSSSFGRAPDTSRLEQTFAAFNRDFTFDTSARMSQTCGGSLRPSAAASPPRAVCSPPKVNQTFDTRGGGTNATFDRNPRINRTFDSPPRASQAVGACGGGVNATFARNAGMNRTFDSPPRASQAVGACGGGVNATFARNAGMNQTFGSPGRAKQTLDTSARMNQCGKNQPFDSSVTSNQTIPGARRGGRKGGCGGNTTL